MELTKSELQTLIGAMAKHVAALERQRDASFTRLSREALAVHNQAIAESARILNKLIKMMEAQNG